MATITTRSGKGSTLTFAETDANFTNLNTDKLELGDLSVSTASASGAGSLSYNNSTGVFTFTPSVPGTTTTINNNADNRIITGSGSANTGGGGGICNHGIGWFVATASLSITDDIC